jgi:hypothetical protein
LALAKSFLFKTTFGFALAVVFDINMYNISMIFTSIISDYFRWHYGRAFGELFHVWLNFLWFVIHFFSLPQLGRSIFSPWKRMTEEKQGGFSFEGLATYLIINLLSRLVGFLMRGTVILLGLIVLTITILTGFVTALFWLAAPVVIVVFLGLGVTLLISNILI